MNLIENQDLVDMHHFKPISSKSLLPCHIIRREAGDTIKMLSPNAINVCSTACLPCTLL